MSGGLSLSVEAVVHVLRIYADPSRPPRLVATFKSLDEAEKLIAKKSPRTRAKLRVQLAWRFEDPRP